MKNHDSHLALLASRLVGLLDPLIKDRTYRFKTYKNCFVCSEVVDCLVQEELASSREHAVALGVELQEQSHFWYHVVDEQHLFSDKYLFFRLATGTAVTSSSNGIGINHGGQSLQQLDQHQEKKHNINRTSSSVPPHDKSTLHVLAIKLLEGLEIKERTYRLRKYKKCFVCSEAIDYMIAEGLVKSRKEAVAVGIALQRETNFWHHVVDHHLFADSFLFFRLSREEDTGQSNSQVLVMDETSKSWTTTSSIGASAIYSMLQASLSYSTSPPKSDRRLPLSNFCCHKEEKQILRNALQRTTNTKNPGTNTPQMIFIGGPSGSGKTTLAQSVFANEIMSPNCFFVAAKFDQIGGTCCSSTKQSAAPPFTVLREWMRDLASQLLEDKAQKKIRAALLARFEDSPKLLQAIEQLLPKEQVMCLFSSLPMKAGSSISDIRDKKGGKERESRPSVASTTPTTSATDVLTIKLCVQAFFRALASSCTLVLLADDIMWSDDLTLDILGFLIMDRELGNLLVVASYRDNEVDENHPLNSWKQSLDDYPVISESIQTVILANLTLQPVQRILAKCLNRQEDEVEEFATLLLERTDGNIFFLIQFLEKIQDVGNVFYDPVRFRWAFSINDILTNSTFADNVGELVCSRISHLPPDGREILKLASLFGCRLDTELLEITKSAASIHIEDVGVCLENACEGRMLIRISNTHYKFAHDQIQSAAFCMLPPGDEIIRIRWNIARLLLAHPFLLENDSWVFSSVDQLQHAVDLVVDENDRVSFAKVCLAAGTRSAGMSAFQQASTYLGIGVKLLGGRKAFAAHYDLAMQLYTLLCNMTYSLGQHDSTKEVAEVILMYSKTWADRIPPLMIQFQCWLAGPDPAACLEFGLELCETLGGEKIPRNPTISNASQEGKRLKSLLKDYSDEKILNLPQITDKNMERCLSVLCKLTDVSYHAQEIILSEIIHIRCVLITLQYGLSEWAPQALVAAAQHSISHDRDLREGTRFARLAEELLYLCPIGTAHYSVALILGFVDTSRKHLDICMTGYKMCMASGDLSAACFSLTIYCWSYFYSGLPFLPLLEDIEEFAIQFLEYRQTFHFLHALPLWQTLLNLSGKSKDPLDVQNGDAIEKRRMAGLGDMKVGKETPKSYGMQIAFFTLII